MQTHSRKRLILLGLLLPTVVVIAYFLIYPLIFLFFSGLQGAEGSKSLQHYGEIVLNARYRRGLITSLVLSVAVTITTVIISTVLAFFLARNTFLGKRLIISLITFPLAFPGVVVGFMTIILFGQTGLFGKLTQLLFGKKVVFAYTLTGLFLAYLYFSIPRVTMAVIAAITKLDRSLEEAARSLGANGFHVLKDIILPALTPSLLAGGALCFATSMGAFGTAFTIAQQIDVLPMLIYTEYTLAFNIGMASAMAVVLGLITLAVLSIYRLILGNW